MATPRGATTAASAAPAGAGSGQARAPTPTGGHGRLDTVGQGWARLRVVVGPLLAVAVAGLVGTVAFRARVASPVALPGALAATGASIRVHVTGAVQAPGVYELRLGDRVAEAVRAAGGTTAETDDAMLNLAQRVHDEQRLDVPVRAAGDPPGARPAGGSTSPGRDPTPGGLPRGRTAEGAPVAGVAPTAGADADLEALLASPTNPEGGARVDANRATVAQLEGLPGIGTVSAKRVVAWRTERGPVRTVADLRAAGLSVAILRKALPYLALG